MMPRDMQPDAAPFGSNAVRLSPREWLVALAIIAAVLVAVPPAWTRVEPLEVAADGRLPYRLSNDYWTFDRVARAAAGRGETLVVGDSVVWGHYVTPEGTLSHYLSADAGGGRRFANLGVDGIHPAAMAGLVEYYGGALRGRDVVLHCNLLWMSSDRHDLATSKEFAFNHPRLVPQFVPWIPCYREPVAGRLAVVIGRRLPFSAWSRHMQVAYWENLDLPSWTLQRPYTWPIWAEPLTLGATDEPPSPRPDARPWAEKGIAAFGPAWVELDTSIQWRLFRRTVEVLRGRGNRVFVLVGPFNEHMLTEKSLEAYKQRTAGVAAWLQSEGVPFAVPDALPTEMYADASHPLASGYRLLAERLATSDAFRRFVAREGDAP